MTAAAAAPPAPPSALAPLRHRVFLVLWTATVVGNVGLWMRDTASAWLMTELAPSPVMVALVQAAATLPVVLLSFPAGALADIVDRRRLMIAVQAALAVLSVALAVLTWLGLMDPATLLVLTLLAGVGGALSGPVWQSVVPELVPRGDLKAAVALNSLGVNISRALGPALGGAIVAWGGIAAAYLADVLTYAVVLAALLWWPRREPETAFPEAFGGAMRAGLRYALRSAPLRRVLLRALLFFVPASCFWALLPLVARVELGAGAGAYGLLLGAVGLGAVLGALALPRLRGSLSGEAVALAATVVTGVATLLLSVAGTVVVGALVLATAGAAWLSMLTTLNAAAQSVLPNWVRGRGLAIYLTVFSFAMTAGSVAWGQAAAASSLDASLVAAGLACLLAGLLGRLAPLPAGDADMAPSGHWPEPRLAGAVEADRGPVMVSVEYRVPLSDQADFAAAARELRDVRLRDGAVSWGLMADAADAERVTEWFLVESWAEHMRQHGRVTVADAAIQARVRAFHQGSAAPAVRHLLTISTRAPEAGERGP